MDSKAAVADDSTCLYDILGVPRDADDALLKKSFRKVALKWHPDKHSAAGPDAAARATVVFQRVQHAYETLSDRNERAWYDDHRDAILRGGHAQGGGDAREAAADDDTPDLFHLFSASAYSGYNDGRTGFFGVFASAFADIADGEQQAMSDGRELPRFGAVATPWTAVEEFYGCFRDFVSKRSFGWADLYFTPDAPNRDVRRAMDKANNKERAAKRRDFEKLVRRLADFVWKRDPRVVEHKRQQLRELLDVQGAVPVHVEDLEAVQAEGYGTEQGLSHR